MPHVGLGRFHKVRDQIMAALELHVDLRERIFVHVPQLHQAVVDGHGEKAEYDDDADHHNQSYKSCVHSATCNAR